MAVSWCRTLESNGIKMCFFANAYNVLPTTVVFTSFQIIFITSIPCGAAHGNLTAKEGLLQVLCKCASYSFIHSFSIRLALFCALQRSGWCRRVDQTLGSQRSGPFCAAC